MRIRSPMTALTTGEAVRMSPMISICTSGDPASKISGSMGKEISETGRFDTLRSPAAGERSEALPTVASGGSGGQELPPKTSERREALPTVASGGSGGQELPPKTSERREALPTVASGGSGGQEL